MACQNLTHWAVQGCNSVSNVPAAPLLLGAFLKQAFRHRHRMQAADVKASPYEPGVYFVKDQSWQESMGCTLDRLQNAALARQHSIRAGWGEI